MMNHHLRATLPVCTFALLSLAAPVPAQDAHADAAECKDSSVLSRMPGCWIEACDAKDFDSLDVFSRDRETGCLRSDAVLAEMVTLRTNNPSWRMRIEGHTDNVGKTTLNASLSIRRAAAVEAWLAAHGIDSTRLTHDGYGDSRPVGDNSTEEGRARNRRVELVKL